MPQHRWFPTPQTPPAILTTLTNTGRCRELIAVAEEQRDLAIQQSEVAEEQRDVADKQRAVAEEQRNVAEEQRDNAEAARLADESLRQVRRE